MSDQDNYDIHGTKEHRADAPECLTCARRVQEIAEKFEAEAKASHEKKTEARPYRKTTPREVQIGRRVPGTEVTALPYWDHVGRYNEANNDGSHMVEDDMANADNIDAAEAIGNRPLSEQGELMMEAYRDVVMTLTEQQREILRLSSDGVWSPHDEQLHYTARAVADELDIAPTTVSTVLGRIKAKVQRRYEILKTAAEK